jgi:hypothetical protein
MAMLLKWPTFLVRKLPNTSAWPPAVLSNILLMELNGPRGALLLDTQCARLGPAYCMRKGADSLEWATLLDASLLSRALEKAAEHLGWVMCPTSENAVNCLKWALHFA